MDRFETMKNLIEGKNISINDEGAYRELLECADEKTFDRHVEATKSLIDNDKVQYQYVLDQNKTGELSLKVDKIGGDTSSVETEKKEEEKKEEVKAKEESSKETEKKEEEAKEKTETKEESSEQKPEEKKEDLDTDTTKKQQQDESDNGDILDQMSRILEAVMSGQQKYGRLEETVQDMSKKFNEELETLSKKVQTVSKMMKDVEDSEFVSKSLDDDTTPPKEKKEDDLFGSVFNDTPLQRRFEGSSESGNW